MQVGEIGDWDLLADEEHNDEDERESAVCDMESDKKEEKRRMLTQVIFQMLHSA